MKKIWLLILIILLVIITITAFFIARWFYRGLLPPFIIPPGQDMSKLTQLEPPDGAQLLIFPINSGQITAGYQNATYLEKRGFQHYGIDFTTVYVGHGEIVASGMGKVLGTEWRGNSLGHIVVIRYDDVYIPETGAVASLIARYYHMQSISIAEDDVVLPGQVIGSIDSSHEWYNHIHIELDANVEFPFNTPQVADASSEMLSRHPVTSELLEPVSVLAVGREQWIFVHPGSESCTEKDEPRYAEKR